MPCKGTVLLFHSDDITVTLGNNGIIHLLNEILLSWSGRFLESLSSIF